MIVSGMLGIDKKTEKSQTLIMRNLRFGGAKIASLVVFVFLLTGLALAIGFLNRPVRLQNKAAELPENYAQFLPGPKSQWEMTFNDEFSQVGVDLERWNTRYQGGEVPVNNELQAYVDNAFSFGNGILGISGKAVSPPVFYGWASMNFTSGILTTADKFSQKYGYFEIRAKLPPGKGISTAFWMFAQDAKGVNEIDVFERRATDDNTVMQLNWWGEDYQHAGYNLKDVTIPNLASAYHVFGVDWKEGQIDWYVDGKKTFTSTRNVVATPMYILVSMFMGGDNRPAPDVAKLPASFGIDYVRVYRKKDNVSGAVKVLPLKRVFDGPVSISLATSSVGSQIRYTLDGSDPFESPTSVVYAEPFVLDHSATLKAYSVGPSVAPSALLTENFYVFNQTSDGNANFNDTEIFNVGQNPVSGKLLSTSDNKILLSGAGFDVWNSQDTFRFAFQKLPAEGSIESLVYATDPISGIAKSGLMIRKGLEIYADYVALVLTPQHGTQFYGKPSNNNWADAEKNEDMAPFWLKLERHGNVVSGFKKKNVSDQWVHVGDYPFSGGDAYAGLVQTSTYHNLTNTAVFEGTTTSGTIPSACKSLSASGQVISKGGSLEFRANAKTPIPNFAYALYNMDNLWGFNNPKQVYFSAGTPFVVNNFVTPALTNSFTLNFAEIDKVDLNWFDNSGKPVNSKPRNLQLKAFFVENDGRSSPVDPNCAINFQVLNVQNGGFEDDTDNNGLPDSFKSRRLTAEDKIVTNSAHGGAKSFSFAGLTAGSKAKILEQVLSTKTILKGTTFSISGWNRMPKVLSSGSMRMSVVSSNTDGTATTYPVTFPTNAHSAWVNSTGNFSLVKDSAQLKLQIKNTANSKTYVDDLEFVTPAISQNFSPSEAAEMYDAD